MAQYLIGRKLNDPFEFESYGAIGATSGMVGQFYTIPVGAKPGRLITIGAYMNPFGVPTTFRYGIYAPSAGNPGPRMGATATGVISVAAGYANRERSVTLVDPGYGLSQSGIVVQPGQQIFLAYGGDGVEGVEVVTVPEGSPIKYRRTTGGLTAPNPYAHNGVTTTEGVLTLYGIVEENRPPLISTMDPAGGEVLGDTTPDFSFLVTDQDRTEGYNDYPTQAIIRVYEKLGTNAYVLVGTQTVSLVNPGEGTGSVSVGPIIWTQAALTLGKTYGWTVEVKDVIGGSTGTGYGGRNAVTGLPDGTTDFVLTTHGIIEGTAPTGKQTTLTPVNFVGTYTHPTAQALDKVRLRIMKLNDSGTYVAVQTSALLDIANVSSGNTVTISWATSGFGALEWGTDYRVDWELTSVAGGDTSEWLPGSVFHTNYLPQKPVAVNPSGGQGVLSRPLIQATIEDDDDTPNPPGSLTSEFEITGPFTLANGTFDTNTTSWTYAEDSASFSQTFTRDTTAPHTGAGNARIVQSAAPATTTDRFRIEEQHYPCYEGNQYVLRAWVKRSSTHVVPQLGMRWYQSNDSTIIQTDFSADFAPTAATWTLVTYTVTAPAGARFMQPILAGKNASTTPTLPYTLEWDDIDIDDGVRYLRAGAHAGSNVFTYQTTTNDLPEFATYTIRARGKDGNNTGPWSDPESFVYTSGPSATITAPTEAATIASSQPTFQWTLNSGSQVLYRVRIINAADIADEIYDSGWIADADDRAYTVPTGYLGNSAAYIGELWIDDGLVNGVVDTVNFTVTFSAPPVPGNVTAVPVAVGTETDMAAVLISWDPVSTSPENLHSIEVWADDGETDTRIATFTDAGATFFLYHYPRDGVTTEYRVRQRVRDGANITDGLFGTTETQVNLNRISIISVVSPYTRRLYLPAWSSQRITLLQEQNWQVPAGATDYVEIPGLLRGRDVAFTFQTYNSQDGSGRSAEDDADMFFAMFDSRDTLCIRDARRGKWFGRINGSPSVSYQKGGVRAAIDVTFRRTSYDEGA